MGLVTRQVLVTLGSSVFLGLVFGFSRAQLIVCFICTGIGVILFNLIGHRDHNAPIDQVQRTCYPLIIGVLSARIGDALRAVLFSVCFSSLVAGGFRAFKNSISEKKA
jgi:hypothetical protein